MKLSVIVPVYNVENYLEKCIKSIINQSYKNLEVILIDDGSTDHSPCIMKKYAQMDNRIKIITKINGGQLSARKEGIKVATGEYIVSVDSDDWIDEDRFATLVEQGLVNNPDMCYMMGMKKEYSNHTVHSTDDDTILGEYCEERIHKELMCYPVGIDLFMLRRMEFSHCSWCVKYEIYVKNVLSIDDRIRRVEDFISIFSCLLSSKIVTCVKNDTYHYIQREGSISKRKTNWNQDHSLIYFKQLKTILDTHNESITKEVMNVAVQYLYHNIFLTNYKKLYDFYPEYLFPFNNVLKGSKIIVYGAGNIGVEMVNAIDSDGKYDIVAWVDKKVTSNPRSNHRIDQVGIINSLEYDYIVVAILVSQIAQEVKENLINLGVENKKIQIMNCKNMKYEDLSEMLGG